MLALAVTPPMQEASLPGLPETLLRVGLFLSVYLVFTLAQLSVVRHRLLRSVGLQLNLMVLASLMMLFLKPLLARMHPYVWDTVKASVVFMGIIIGLRLADVLFFDVMAQWRKKAPAPLVVRDIGRWVMTLLALVFIIRIFFPGINLNVLAVSSIVVGYIVGNATQDTLGNLVAGLALNTERPFQIGDWVTVSSHTGRVVDTTWRATRLRTKSEDYIVIPNAAIAKEPITNYSRPTHCHGCYLTVGVDYESAPTRVREVIMSVMADVPEILTNPPPIVFMAGYGDFSMNFTLKFFIEDYARVDLIQSMVMDRLWYAFKRAGIGIPYPIQDVRLRSAAADERRGKTSQRQTALALIKGVDIFASLSEAEFEKLADAARPMPFAEGETLFRQDDSGDSFYIIGEGSVEVSVKGTDGRNVAVAHLRKGAFFGEMSLLTGETRSATVTAQTDVEVLLVAKRDFAGLLKTDKDLTGKLAAVLEKRSAERQEKIAIPTINETVPVTQSAIADRIRRFFELGQ